MTANFKKEFISFIFIYNSTLETLIGSELWKIPSFFLTRKRFKSDNFSIASDKQKCAGHLYKETANENKQFKETKIMISNSFFIVVNLCMESLGIALGNSLNGEVVDQGIEH